MSDDVITTEHYTAPDGTRYRIRIIRDTEAESPRGDSNVTTIHTFDRQYNSPDGYRGRNGSVTVDPIIPRDYTQDCGVDIRRARRWVNLFGKDVGILAFEGIERVGGGWGEGSLTRGTRTYRGTLDETADGYIAITRDGWDECMGPDAPLTGAPWLLTSKGEPDPDNTEGHRTPSATEVMQQEIESYNRWATGDYVGFVVQREVTWVRKDYIDVTATMTTWEDMEDGTAWGIDDADYALTEARTYLPKGSVLTPVVSA